MDKPSTINEVTVIIRGINEHDETNFHKTFDLDTSRDYENCVFNGKKYNIRRDSFFSYPPSGVLAPFKKVRNWLYRKLRDKFSFFTKREKYEYAIVFKEGEPEPIALHKDFLYKPRESTQLLSKVYRSPQFKKALNEALQPEGGFGNLLIPIVVVVAILVGFLLLNGQFHWIGGAPATQIIQNSTAPVIIQNGTSVPVVPVG